MASSGQADTSANHWIVAATVMLGTFMAVMDISVVNVAMPHMMGSFSQSLSAITWVATSYSIAEIIMSTMAGWWSTLMGRKRVYMLSMLVFVAGSVLAGTARTFPQMMLFRVLQGLGGGCLIPISLAILRETFPEEKQGIAMAFYGMGVVLAPAFGPVLGGWLTDHYGWPAIFFINVPVGLFGLFMAAAFIRDPAHLKRGIKRIDWGGIALLTVGLTGLQVVLERGQQENWFASNWIVAGTVVTAASLVLLVVWDLRVKEPVVDFRLLRNVPLSLGSSIGLIFGIGLFGTTFVLPQLTQDLMGYTAYDSGMVLMPRAITLFICMPIAGALYKYVDSRILVLLGLAILFWTFHDLSRLSLDVGFWNLVPLLLLMGAGMPFMFVTLTTVSLSTVKPENTTVASSLYTLSRRVGGNIGYALVSTVLARHTQVHRADLVGQIHPLNPNFVTYHDQAMQLFMAHGRDPTTARLGADALVNTIVNRQATMMGYNDVSWFLGIMFVAVLPLVFFLPGRHKKQASAGAESSARSR